MYDQYLVVCCLAAGVGMVLFPVVRFLGYVCLHEHAMVLIDVGILTDLLTYLDSSLCLKLPYLYTSMFKHQSRPDLLQSSLTDLTNHTLTL